ncbi:hypothetical protein Pmar_PMAR020132, partial [Perkinsus marinus ATCC 50983]
MPSSTSTITTSTSEEELLAPYDVSEPVVINTTQEKMEILVYFKERLMTFQRQSTDDVDQ